MRQVSFTSRSEDPVFLFCISVLVYSLQEETTYFHYALRILHLDGKLGEIAYFELDDFCVAFTQSASVTL